MGLTQLVQSPTHNKGHTLDLIITRDIVDPYVSNINISDILPSDHSLIYFETNLARLPPMKIVRQVRNRRAANSNSLSEYLSENPLIMTDGMSADQLVQSYNDNLNRFMDTVAPLQRKETILKARAPWYEDSHRKLRQQLRGAERRWKTSQLEVHRQIFMAERRQYSHVLNESRALYHKSRVQNAKDQRELFSLVDDLVGDKKQTSLVLPQHDDPVQLAINFSDFFTDKVAAIRGRFSSVSTTLETTNYDQQTFDCFSPVTQLTVKRVISSINAKSCLLDPIDTSLAKACLDELTPILTRIINCSFETGTVPMAFKEAIVKPLLKKQGLDSNELSNYRPVSNISFLSKVTEKIAMQQLHKHLSQNELYTKFQSAYRQNHSTETALLRVHNDILNAIDNNDYRRRLTQ